MTLTAVHKLLLGAAAVVFAAGTVLAIAQPGDLGDDDVSTAQEATTTTSTVAATTTTTELATTTSLADDGTTLTTTTALPTTTTVASTTTSGAASTTTTIASGLGVGGNGSVNPDGVISDTGGESWIGVGLALLGLGLVTRRLTRQHA